jgi:hypothetical protein
LIRREVLASKPAQWHLASGPMTDFGHSFTGTLEKDVGGQCLSCGFAGRPTLVGNDGDITVNIASEKDDRHRPWRTRLPPNKQ